MNPCKRCGKLHHFVDRLGNRDYCSQDCIYTQSLDDLEAEVARAREDGAVERADAIGVLRTMLKAAGPYGKVILDMDARSITACSPDEVPDDAIPIEDALLDLFKHGGRC